MAFDNLIDRFPERTHLSLHPKLKRAHDAFDSLEEADFHKIISPIHQIINDYFIEAYGYAPLEIATDFDTRTIQPYDAQRGGAWHRDKIRSSTQLLVANVLPTKYLVGNSLDASDSTYWSSKLLDVAVGNGPSTKVNEISVLEGIKAGKLSIYEPDNYSLTISDDYIHHSPQNLGEAAIQRAWMRYFIFDH
ncbi:MAG: hypothetical protein WAW80_01045 [Candidatus Saccharimonadales bacterium]